jgi:hypothetical protein
LAPIDTAQSSFEELDATSSWSRVFVAWREENWEAKYFKIVMAV